MIDKSHLLINGFLFEIPLLVYPLKSPYPASPSQFSIAALLVPLGGKNAHCDCVRQGGRVRVRSHNQCTLSVL